MRKFWKEYFEDLYNIDTQEQAAIHIFGFVVIRGDNFFGEESVG